MVIYKYHVPIDGIISAPIIKPLRVDLQAVDSGGMCLFLWAVVDRAKEDEKWLVQRIGTGWPLDDLEPSINLDSYLNTTVSSSAPYVWHFFCRKLVDGFDL